MEALNITFVKGHNDSNTLDVICVNGFANGLSYPYTGNTMVLDFTSGNTYVIQNFDGGKAGFQLLENNIKTLTGNLITPLITTNLTYSLYQTKGSSELIPESVPIPSSGGAGKRTRKKHI